MSGGYIHSRTDKSLPGNGEKIKYSTVHVACEPNLFSMQFGINFFNSDTLFRSAAKRDHTFLIQPVSEEHIPLH